MKRAVLSAPARGCESADGSTHTCVEGGHLAVAGYSCIDQCRVLVLEGLRAEPPLQGAARRGECVSGWAVPGAEGSGAMQSKSASSKARRPAVARAAPSYLLHRPWPEILNQHVGLQCLAHDETVILLTLSLHHY